MSGTTPPGGPPQPSLGGHHLGVARGIVQALTPKSTSTPYQWGVVSAVGGAGNTISVKLDGSATATTGIRYLATYSPVVNDVVLVLRGVSGPTDRLVVGTVGQSSGGVATVPTGVVNPFAGSSAPSGWLICDGSLYSTTTYAALYNVVGTTYGSGAGTFAVPDLRGRTVHGVGSVGTNGQPTLALAGTGGEQNHTLSVGELAAHNHTDSGHTHAEALWTSNNEAAGYGLTTSASFQNRAMVNTGSGQNTNAGAANITNTGSGTAHNTMSPYIALNYIIKT